VMSEIEGFGIQSVRVKDFGVFLWSVKDLGFKEK